MMSLIKLITDDSHVAYLRQVMGSDVLQDLPLSSRFINEMSDFCICLRKDYENLKDKCDKLKVTIRDVAIRLEVEDEIINLDKIASKAFFAEVCLDFSTF